MVQRLPYKISLGNFTIKSGDNHLQRPVGGGVVESGALKIGKTQTTLTNNTATGQYLVTNLETFGYGQGPTEGQVDILNADTSALQT